MSKYNMDDLTGGFKELVDLLGFDAAAKLARAMGGTAVYIPKIDTVERINRNQQIAAGFNGSNYAELALKYDLTERQIRLIIESMRTPAITIEDFLPKE